MIIRTPEGRSTRRAGATESGPARRGAAVSPRSPQGRNWLLVAVAAIALALFLSPLGSSGGSSQKLSYSQLKTDITANQVRSIAIGPDGAISGKLTSGASFSSSYPVGIQDPQFAQLLDSHQVQVATQPAQSSVGSVLLGLLPLALVVGLVLWMARSARRPLAGVGGIGRSKGKLYDTERPTTTFADVAGYDGAKREVAEVVDFLRNPQRYERAGAVGPKGVLMVGPPGTGKTLLARAVAGEAGVPFISVTGSSFVEMFVGVGAARVRDLFADARRLSPSIVFIDEIDAIGQRRGGQLVANDERDQTLNQMLAELDGFDQATGVVLIAATNRPEVLDPALLRPGRFDRQVVIPLPTQRERLAILTVHSAGKPIGDDVDLGVVARGTPGFSGADLANRINEAAIFAVRDNREVIKATDFAEARDRILLGHRDSSNALLPEEKHAVAVHESGHALVAALSEHGDPVDKVTILPAGQALGVTQQLPVDERHLYSASYLKDSLAIRMGGRAAELAVFGETSTGAADDLAGATALATRMVREFGMSPALGPVGFAAGSSPTYLGTEQLSNRPYAEATQRAIDREVTTLLREAERRAVDVLTVHRAALDRLTELLLDRETIDGNDVDAVLRWTKERPPPITANGHQVVPGSAALT
jgi:cell division protease FtsH